MRPRSILALAPFFFAAALAAPLRQPPAPPQDLFGPLYGAVELSRVFPDSKQFADAVPNAPPPAIRLAYEKQQPRTPTALKRFVLAHFTLPQDGPAATVRAGLPLGKHIDALWPVLTRRPQPVPPNASLLPLPHAYVVPGGRFRELYYWDSYFTMLGLAESGRRDLVNDMVRNFAALIDRYGHVPNGNRTYYLSRSQPPFFYLMVALTNARDPAAAYARYLPELKREHAFWMKGARAVRLPGGERLNRYWDGLDRPRDESFAEDVELAKSTPRSPRVLYRNIRAAAESGWDFSSRWLADGKTLAAIDTVEVVPVDLNALLYGLEKAIGQGCARLKDRACTDGFAARAARRRAAVDKYLWSGRDGVYRDWHLKTKAPRRALTAATLYPLFTGAASPRQAAAVAHTARALVKPGGLVTTLAATGQQWDAPNGWAPLQWIAVEGLRRNGAAPLAGAIACRWLINVRAVYRKTGKLMEKYDVEHLGRAGGGGEYPLQDGFGWTNGVTKKLMTLYPAYALYASAAQCPKP